MVEYYKSLADVIGIFWQFHDERIQLGNIPFAATTPYGEREVIIPYSPVTRLEEFRRESRVVKLKPITEFSESVVETIDSSFQQFLLGNEIAGNPSHFLQHTPIPKETTRFFDPFVTDKITETAKLYNEIYLASPEEVAGIQAQEIHPGPLADRVRQGFNSGVKTTTQLNSLFREDFKPVLAIAMSKIKIADVKQEASEIGLNSNMYPLLDNSSLGLERKRLREFGLGDTLGCPASMKVSKETHNFLRQKGVDVSNTTMLDDFATKLPERFDLHVGEWFSGLSPNEREQNIAPKELRILTGEARRNALEMRERQDCPYGYGKERR